MPTKKRVANRSTIPSTENVALWSLAGVFLAACDPYENARIELIGLNVGGDASPVSPTIGITDADGSTRARTEDDEATSQGTITFSDPQEGSATLTIRVGLNPSTTSEPIFLAIPADVGASADTGYEIDAAVGTFIFFNRNNGEGEGTISWQYAIDDAISELDTTDSIAVRVVDSEGNTSADITIAIMVTGINNEPMVTVADADGAGDMVVVDTVMTPPTTRDRITVKITEANSTSPTSSGNHVITYSDEETALADMAISGSHDVTLRHDEDGNDDGITTETVTEADGTSYGDFTLTRNDNTGTLTWSYALNNEHTRLETLDEGDTIEELLVVFIADTGIDARSPNIRGITKGVHIVVEITGIDEPDGGGGEVGGEVSDGFA